MVTCHNEEYETILRRDESNVLSGCGLKLASGGQHTQNDPGKTT
jgi:hypothetical protein